MGFVKKTEGELRWDEMKRLLRLEGRFMLDRAMNAVLDEANEDRLLAEAQGHVVEIPDSRAAVQDFFRRVMEKVLNELPRRTVHALPPTKR